MKHTDVFKTFCKAFGLYFAIQVLINIKETFFFGVVNKLYDDNPVDFYYFTGAQIFNVIFNGMAAWILISKADLITSKFLKDSSDRFDIMITKRDLMELIIIGVSGVIILDAIPDFFHKIVYYVYFNPYEEYERERFWTNQNRADIFYFGFKMVVGLLVLVNYRIISKRLISIGEKDDHIAS
jgi:hypothetical protein